ncbi:MAG: ATP-binding cassette domain-containing protein [Gemmatimonadetes bacterium]|nr:ATP-binding cassette domain-containing protein [Gemmatimonadota bacterium]MCC6769666.1 ATP-binding cassette domain-containing protein [Gemmatimonadaceae bacterium]
MTVALELDGLRKRFGVVEALAGASMRVRGGTVHALLGENGAGKTTLMRIVYGTLRADAGAVSLDGAPATFRTSADAIARGIGMVHQHFALVPAMTVAENVALGMRGHYDARAAAARVRDLGATTGLVLDPDARVETLPVGAQQRLEIVKALARNARLLILDEPTAVLAPDEADDLMRWIRRFRDDGHAVVLITHKLREALAIADDVTVLRRGTTVLTGSVAALDEPTLVAALLGETSARADAARPLVSRLPLTEQRTDVPSHPGRDRRLVATLQNISVSYARRAPILHNVTLDLRAGEILGVAAVEGSGQHELMRVLAGRLTPTSGTLSLPHAVAFIPEDRHRHAMALDMSLVENVALRGLSKRRGRMEWRALRNATNEILSRFDVRAPGPLASGRALSGGNQQKLILGRELADRPEMIVAENPTRGLDIRAAAAVQGHLRAARDAGSAVVMYSSDLDEVLSLASRLIVVHAGRVVHVEHPTRETVGRAMLGAQ